MSKENSVITAAEVAKLIISGEAKNLRIPHDDADKVFNYLTRHYPRRAFSFYSNEQEVVFNYLEPAPCLG